MRVAWKTLFDSDWGPDGIATSGLGVQILGGDRLLEINFSLRQVSTSGRPDSVARDAYESGKRDYLSTGWHDGFRR